MLDEFKFPHAPKTPLSVIVCELDPSEKWIKNHPSTRSAVIDDSLSYPEDFSEVIAFLPAVELPHALKSLDFIVFIDLYGNVGLMPIDNARKNYDPLVREDTSVEEHFRRMYLHKKFTNAMEKAGWHCMTSETDLKAFRDLTQPSGTELFKTVLYGEDGEVDSEEEPLPYDPIPEAILKGLERFAFCEACGHPHDTDAYSFEVDGCESCGAEFDGMNLLGQIFVIGSNEDSMPGLDQEEWA